MKTMTLGSFLSDAEIATAVVIFKQDRNNFHARVLSEIIEPNMARINKSLGQENDARYLAYAVEHVLNQTK